MTREEDNIIGTVQKHPDKQGTMLSGGKKGSIASTSYATSYSSNPAAQPHPVPHRPPVPSQSGGQHRRGVSVDETRVQSGLGRLPPNNSGHSNPSYVAALQADAAQLQSGGIHQGSGGHRRHHSQPQVHHGLPHTSAVGLYNPYSYQVGPVSLPYPSAQSASSHAKQPLPEVKFVNSTVEILEDQIRKEEAPKKKRTRTTPEQLRILQKAFNADPMPNSGTRIALAKKLGMNARAVQVWFQNRRAKAKLEAKRAEGRSASSSGTVSPASTCVDDYDDVQESYDIHVAANAQMKGFMGRMAFPPDLNILNPRPNTAYGSSAQYYPSSRKEPFLGRSQSLPFLVGGLATDSSLFDPSLLGGDGDDALLMGMMTPSTISNGGLMMSDGTGQDDLLMMADDGNTGLLLDHRTEAIPFGPYEFALANNTEGGAGAMDMLPTAIDDQSWPTLGNATVLSSDMTSQSAAALRRSFSLPNVFQSPPDYFHSHHPQIEDELTEQYSEEASGHRRSRSHSISHRPDYPDNVNDLFLTGPTCQFDE